MPKIELTNGEPVPEDRSHTKIIEEGPRAGQQEGYVVLSQEELDQGFVRPLRDSYVHDKCGGRTTMGYKLAATYARNPYFYSGTFCVHCGAHFPVGEDGEFTWAGTRDRVGT